jgi:hypothetical protein
LSWPAAALAILCAAGCYDPALRDCTITCGGSGDCADGQTCAGGYCVASGQLAGTCKAADKPDAAVAKATLHVMVMGGGKVDVDAALSCDDDCMFDLDANVPHELVATPQAERKFQMWTGACLGATTTCTVTLPEITMTPPPPVVQVAAKFNGG